MIEAMTCERRLKDIRTMLGGHNGKLIYSIVIPEAEHGYGIVELNHRGARVLRVFMAAPIVSGLHAGMLAEVFICEFDRRRDSEAVIKAVSMVSRMVSACLPKIVDYITPDVDVYNMGFTPMGR